MVRKAAWAIISIILPMVLPVSWFLKAVLLIIMNVSVIYLIVTSSKIKDFVAKYKALSIGSLFILCILLSLFDFYIIHDQWIKDHPVEQTIQKPPPIEMPEKPIAKMPEKKSQMKSEEKEIGKPSEKKDTLVLDLIIQAMKGEKNCHDLVPEAQKECVRENAHIKYVAMILTYPGLTAEQRVSILQQPTLADMKKKFETLTLNAVASISSNAYTISVPPEVATVYIFLQKPETLENGSSEFLGSVSREEFTKKISQYETMAEIKHMKLILRAFAKDQKQWLQNQIKYNQEFLKKSKFLDPSNNKINEGEEWPVN